MVSNPQLGAKVTDMAKTELDELGESTDDLAGSTAKLQAEIKGLSGVDIMESPTQFKSIYQVFDELATVWDKLTDVQQATIAEKLGGKNGLNTVYSLISNFQTARDVMDEAAESEGSANKELGRAMDSIDGKLAQLSATFQEFANNVLDSDFVKTILDLLNKLGQGLAYILPLAEKLLPILGGIGAVKIGSKLKGLLGGSGGLGEPANHWVPFNVPRILVACT